MTIGAGAPFLADGISLVPDGLGASCGVDFTSEVLVQAAGVDTLTIGDEYLSLFQNAHHALGNAVFLASGGQLTLSNIGSSGEDGVLVKLKQAHSFDMQWLALGTAADTPSGAFLRLSATGSIAGSPGQQLGFARFDDTGAEILITADFSDIGSSSQFLQVLDGGELVGAFSGHTGPVGTVSEWPNGCGKLGQTGGGTTTKCYVGTWDSAIPISIDGGPTLIGDELRILAEGAVDIDHLDGFALQLSDIPSVTITDETVVFVQGDIPTISEWGLTIMTLLVLTLGTIVYGRRWRSAMV